MFRSAGLVLIALFLAGCFGDPPTPPTEEGYRLEPVADGFDSLAKIAFAPDGRMFVTERLAGEIVVVEDGSASPEPWARFDVADDGEQGLLGVALHPEFPQAPWVYAYYTYVDGGEAWNRLVRVNDAGRVETLIDGIPGGVYHDGGALAFDAEGHLWVTTGDGHEEIHAQDPESLGGKVLRVTAEGEAAPGNPFGSGNPVYTIGHRNSFGVALDLKGQAWMTENGPGGDDELNRLVAGGNYGWPDVTGRGGGERFVEPRWVWQQTIAPTGLTFPGEPYPGLVGDVVVGDWITGHVRHLTLDEEGEIAEETRIATAPDGIVDVEAGPDGHVYIATPDTVYRLMRGAS